MASWLCENCHISMEADSSEGEDELCPVCGQPMKQFQRRLIRMFGGSGVGDEVGQEGGSNIGQPSAGQ